MSKLLKQTNIILKNITEKWIKGAHFKNPGVIISEANTIIDEAKKLTFSALPTLSNTMVEPGEQDISNDTVGTLICGILGDLLVHLSNLTNEKDAKLLNFYTIDLIEQAHSHSLSNIWRSVSEPPQPTLEALTDRLRNLTSVLYEFGHVFSEKFKVKLIKRAKRGTPGKTLQSAALFCELRAKQRLNTRLKQLALKLKKQYVKVETITRDLDKTNGLYWPPKEVAVIVQLNEIEEDLQKLDMSLKTCQEIIGTDWPFSIVPKINGLIIGSMAIKPFQDRTLPDPEFEVRWHDDLSDQFFRSNVVDSFDKAIEAAYKISAIFACRNLDDLHEVEGQALQDAIDNYNTEVNNIEKFRHENEDDIYLFLLGFMEQLSERLEIEYESAKNGSSVSDPIASGFYSLLKGEGEMTQTVQEVAAARLLLIQATCHNDTYQEATTSN